MVSGRKLPDHITLKEKKKDDKNIIQSETFCFFYSLLFPPTLITTESLQNILQYAYTEPYLIFTR